MPVILRNTHHTNLSFQLNYLRSAAATNMTPFSYSPMAVNLRRSGNSAQFNINQMCSVDDAAALKIVATSPQVLDLEKRGMLTVIRPTVAVPTLLITPEPAPIAVSAAPAEAIIPVEAEEEHEPTAPIPGAVVAEMALDDVLPSIPKPNSRTTLANLKAYAAQQEIDYPKGIGRKDLYKIIKETF